VRASTPLNPGPLTLTLVPDTPRTPDPPQPGDQRPRPAPRLAAALAGVAAALAAALAGPQRLQRHLYDIWAATARA